MNRAKQLLGSLALAAMALACVFVAAPAAQAHHSGAGFGTDVIEVTGVVKEFQFTNPHSWLQLNVKGEDGKTVEWSIEWGSPNQLGRSGVRPSTFPPGAKATVKIRPMTNGSPVAAFVGAKMADGTVVGRWE